MQQQSDGKIILTSLLWIADQDNGVICQLWIKKAQSDNILHGNVIVTD